MESRWTKKPAYVIWYNAVRADTRIAIPPLRNSVASRKFYMPTSEMLTCANKNTTYKESHDKREQD